MSYSIEVKRAEQQAKITRKRKTCPSDVTVDNCKACPDQMHCAIYQQEAFIPVPEELRKLWM